MLENSKQRYAPVEVGKTVRLPIDVVDRPKIGHPNLLGVVMEMDNGFYKIGTKSGVLPQKFTRNQLEPCDNEFISLKDIPDVETSFRAAIGAESLTGKQGHKHCLCTSGCKTNKCACKKAEMKCNSRCHHSNTCQNK